ncbi:hypothetical protein BDY24DRAFT_404656 [Mrakia frigida]|uniref:uncharacterized protein n=1 Tax=Mrakia frigida TaxID=29902 RepID=UPI003FCC11D0
MTLVAFPPSQLSRTSCIILVTLTPLPTFSRIPLLVTPIFGHSHHPSSSSSSSLLLSHHSSSFGYRSPLHSSPSHFTSYSCLYLYSHLRVFSSLSLSPFLHPSPRFSPSFFWLGRRMLPCPPLLFSAL